MNKGDEAEPPVIDRNATISVIYAESTGVRLSRTARFPIEASK